MLCLLPWICLLIDQETDIITGFIFCKESYSLWRNNHLMILQQQSDIYFECETQLSILICWLVGPSTVIICFRPSARSFQTLRNRILTIMDPSSNWTLLNLSHSHLELFLQLLLVREVFSFFVTQGANYRVLAVLYFFVLVWC